MKPQDQFRITNSTPRARAATAHAETESDARRMEITFLMTATLVFIVMTGLVIGFHFQ